MGTTLPVDKDLAQTAVRSWPGLLLAGACAEQLLEEAAALARRRQVGCPWALVRPGGAAAVTQGPLEKIIFHKVFDEAHIAGSPDLTIWSDVSFPVYEQLLYAEKDQEELPGGYE